AGGNTGQLYIRRLCARRRAVQLDCAHRKRDTCPLATTALICGAPIAVKRTSPMSQTSDASKTAMQRFLDVVEKVGNKVPHPAVIFLILILLVVALSHVLYLLGISVTAQVIEPDGHKPQDPATPSITLDYAYPYAQELFKAHHIEEETIAVKSLLT